MTDDLEGATRREFLRIAGKATAGIGIVGASGFLLVKTCMFASPSEPVSTETHTDEYRIFDGAVTLRRTETDGDFRTNGNICLAVEYEFTFNEPGEYLFEGWVQRYRSNDQKTENWEYDIPRIPATRTEQLSSHVYRLEVSRVVDCRLQRDTLELMHHGQFGRSLVTVGDQIP